MCFNESAEYSDSLAAVMNALQKGVGENSSFPPACRQAGVEEIIKNRGFLKINYLDSLATRQFIRQRELPYLLRCVPNL